MKIRDIEVGGIARLAPMAGISNAPFRLVARECGSALTTSEEIDAISLIRGSPVALDIARYLPEERPIAMQLLGADAGLLVAAAELLQEQGASIIDLNMGCPMRKITRQGKGAALMQDVCATAGVIRALRKAVRVPFTAKIRGGWDDDHLNAVEVAEMLEDEGVEAIVVHPRTRSQLFTGKAPWDVIREVVEAVRIPVTGNGDVTSLAQAREMMALTGCAGVMIGRGALGRPWIFDEGFERLPAPERWAYKRRVITRHIDLIERTFDARYAHNQLRKQLAWYVEAGLPHSNAARHGVHSGQSAEEVKAAYWAWFEGAWETALGGETANDCGAEGLAWASG